LQVGTRHVWHTHPRGSVPSQQGPQTPPGTQLTVVNRQRKKGHESRVAHELPRRSVPTAYAIVGGGNQVTVEGGYVVYAAHSKSGRLPRLTVPEPPARKQ